MRRNPQRAAVGTQTANEGINRISVSFDMQYADQLSQAESSPVISCYFSSPVQGGVPEFPVPEDDAEHRTRVTLDGAIGSNTALPKDTLVMFYQTCTRKNEFNVDCPVTAGIGHALLTDLMEAGAKNASIDVVLREPSSDWNEKGRLRLHPGVKDVRVDARIRWEATSTVGPEFRRVGAQQTNVEQTPQERARIEYINKVMRTEVAMPNTFSDTANVRIPIYYGDFGMMNATAPLPAAAYFMCKVPLSNRMFWTNALDVVLAREGLTVHDVDRMSLDEQSRVMADMICLVIQGMDYIGDIVDHNKRSIKGLFGFIGPNVSPPFDPALVDNGEKFGDLLRTGSGDCEDMGLAIGGQVFPAFLAADFEDHPQLKRCQEIATQYMAVMTLDSVMGAAVGDGKRKLGAHIKCNFLPALWVKQQMEKAAADLSAVAQAAAAAHVAKRTGAGGSGRRIGDSMASSPGDFATGKAPDPIGEAAFLESERIEVIGEAIAGQSALPWKPFAPWADQLKVIIAEGTGMYETRDRAKDELHAARAEVDKDLPSLHGMKKPLVHAPGAKSPFFVGSMVGFTSYWFEQGGNVGGMWIGYTKPGCKTMQRGITFEELAGKSDKISMLAHPAFSAECKADIERALRIRVPPRDLILTPEGVAAHPARCAKLDDIAAHCTKMGRVIPPGAPAAPLYIRAHQLTPETVKAAKGDISRAPRIAGLAYKLEPITDWLCIYRTAIYVA